MLFGRRNRPYLRITSPSSEQAIKPSSYSISSVHLQFRECFHLCKRSSGSASPSAWSWIDSMRPRTGALTEQSAAFDQGESGRGCAVGGMLDGRVSVAELLVKEQHGVAVSRSLHRSGQIIGRRLLSARERPDTFENGVAERLLGRLNLRVVAFVDARQEENLEDRPMEAGEPHVAASYSSQASRGPPGAADLLEQLGMEDVVGTHRDRREQVLAIREMSVGGANRDTEAPTRLRHGEVANAAFADQLDGRIDQGGAEVTVVVAATLAGSGHRCFSLRRAAA